MCCRKEFTEEHIIFFSSRVFYGAPCTSVFLPVGKSRALIYLHTFTFILLALVYASYLSFQKVFLTLIYISSWPVPNMRQCLAPNMRHHLIFGTCNLILGDCRYKKV